MGFQLRARASIISSMLGDVRAMGAPLTDFTVGSVNRSILEAVGTELFSLEQGAYNAAQETINVGTFRNFQFAAQPATTALGKVVFTFAASTSNQVIPAGQQVSVPGTSLVYQVMVAVTVPAGSTQAVALVSCLTSGIAGNTAANTITAILGSLPWATSITVTNPGPLTNALPPETQQQRFNRFQNYIMGLSKGTVYAIEATALQVALYNPDGTILEKVVTATVVEGFNDNGPAIAPLAVIQVFIDNGAGFASPALITAVNQAVNGYVDSSGVKHPGASSGGIITVVIPVVPFPLSVLIAVYIGTGNSPVVVGNNVVNAVNSYIGSLAAGATFVVSEMYAAVLAVQGVTDVRALTPSSNLVPAPGRRITSSGVSVEIGGIIVT